MFKSDFYFFKCLTIVLNFLRTFSLYHSCFYSPRKCLYHTCTHIHMHTQACMCTCMHTMHMATCTHVHSCNHMCITCMHTHVRTGALSVLQPSGITFTSLVFYFQASFISLRFTSSYCCLYSD